MTVKAMLNFNLYPLPMKTPNVTAYRNNGKKAMTVISNNM